MAENSPTAALRGLAGKVRSDLDAGAYAAARKAKTDAGRAAAAQLQATGKELEALLLKAADDLEG